MSKEGRGPSVSAPLSTSWIPVDWELGGTGILKTPRSSDLAESSAESGGSGGKSGRGEQSTEASTVSCLGSQKSELDGCGGSEAGDGSCRGSEVRTGEGEGESEGQEAWVDPPSELPFDDWWLGLYKLELALDLAENGRMYTGRKITFCQHKLDQSDHNDNAERKNNLVWLVA